MGTAQQLLIYGAAAAGGVTFDPTTETNSVLSNGNLTWAAGSSGGTPNCVATTTKATGVAGKVYVEWHYDVTNATYQTIVGLNQAISSQLHNYAIYSDSFINRNGSLISCPTLATGDVVMMAVDFTARNFWLGQNGTWLYSGNPATGANPTNSGTLLVTGTYYFWVNSQNGANHVITARFASGAWSYAAPSGFGPWT